ncbi:MAG: BatA domain-containing protein [Flavobacteriaceae bacterium]|nr:BatA domain-containing protein [Flavobacteriaceae bacterium]
MLFKHPELLYALLLLLIPIIIHLFQLRRFQKVEFTNVQFLKNVVLQTRKSSQLKKWLTLFIRLLLLAAIIVAFAQPYTSKFQNLKINTKTVIYLDNSFSMQAKGEKGELLRRAVQDVISVMNDKDEITVFTNSNTFKNATKKTVKNELLNLEYTSNQLNYDAVILKGKQLFNKEASTLKHLVLISDFQQQQKDLIIAPDSLININLVQLKPINTNNISIDSVYISKTNASNIELTVLLKQQDNTVRDISISLFNNDNLIAKTSVNSNGELKGTFTLPDNNEINGKITIEDANLQFDNTLYFNINQRPKINVLTINSANDNYLKRVFTDDEFSYKATAFNQLNYNDIEQQSLIVLNELDNLPLALINALKTFSNNGGYILTIPSISIDKSSYNQLFTNYSNMVFGSINTSEKKLTTINYSHPIYSDVFDKKVSNFQYPKVNSFYELTSGSSPILQFEDGKPFLLQSGNLFVFSSALNPKNSNFIDSPLIVPTLYNIGRQSLQLPKLYYTIGRENTFDINTTMQQDDILKLKSSVAEIIPQQRTYSNKVTITTSETPDLAAIYEIANKTEILEHISYNYNRNESEMSYLSLNTIKNAKITNSIPQIFNDIKSDVNVNELWKWFVIFAIILLVLEMLILRYFK